MPTRPDLQPTSTLDRYFDITSNLDLFTFDFESRFLHAQLRTSTSNSRLVYFRVRTLEPFDLVLGLVSPSAFTFTRPVSCEISQSRSPPLHTMFPFQPHRPMMNDSIESEGPSHTPRLYGLIFRSSASFGFRRSP